MIVDTGASTIVLRPEDAKKVGIDVSKLSLHRAGADREWPAQRPRGCASTRCAIGPLERDDVDALVAEPGL